MKTIIDKLLTYGLLLVTFVLPVACSDWNEPEAVDIDINSAKDQNPELWARYMQVLHTYSRVNITLLMPALITHWRNRLMKEVISVRCPIRSIW